MRFFFFFFKRAHRDFLPMIILFLKLKNQFFQLGIISVNSSNTIHLINCD